MSSFSLNRLFHLVLLVQTQVVTGQSPRWSRQPNPSRQPNRWRQPHQMAQTALSSTFAPAQAPSTSAPSASTRAPTLSTNTPTPVNTDTLAPSPSTNATPIQKTIPSARIPTGKIPAAGTVPVTVPGTVPGTDPLADTVPATNMGVANPHNFIVKNSANSGNWGGDGTAWDGTAPESWNVTKNQDGNWVDQNGNLKWVLQNGNWIRQNQPGNLPTHDTPNSMANISSQQTEEDVGLIQQTGDEEVAVNFASSTQALRFLLQFVFIV